MAGLRYQPQGMVRLNRASQLLGGAQGIISAAQPFNLVSRTTLRTAGTVAVSGAAPGKLIQFRMNGYAETEVLPAIGTGSFVEFWVGYPLSGIGAKGSVNDPGFLTGSSANQFGICGTLGNGHGGARWGCVNNWNAGTFYDAGEILPLNVITVLVVVRRASSLELWRNGMLIQKFTGISPTSMPAQSLIVGSFVEDTGYWPSNSDTVTAGRIAGEWSPEQVKIFSTNSNSIFLDASEDDDYAAALVAPSGVVASITWGEGSDAYSIATLLTNRVAGAWSEGDEISSISVTAANLAGMTWAEGSESSSASGIVTDRGALAWIEQGDAFALSVAVASPPMAVAAALSWSEAGDSASLAARLTSQAVLAIAEQGDTWALTAYAERPPVISLTVRFNILPRNWGMKTVHFIT